MKEFDDLKALLRDKESFDMNVLAGAFENISKSNKNYKLSIIVFASLGNPIRLFKEEWGNKDFSFDIENYNGFYVINLTRKIKRKRVINGSFGISRLNATNIWLAFTSESSDFFENGVVRFIESYKPDISRIYLSSAELRELFEHVEDGLSSKISVKKAILYSHIREGQIHYHESNPKKEDAAIYPPSGSDLFWIAYPALTRI
ncbi:MAG: hypothetical protein ACP5PV_02415 [Methanothrix sp.]